MMTNHFVNHTHSASLAIVIARRPKADAAIPMGLLRRFAPRNDLPKLFARKIQFLLASGNLSPRFNGRIEICIGYHHKVKERGDPRTIFNCLGLLRRFAPRNDILKSLSGFVPTDEGARPWHGIDNFYRP